jgi:hypothetical protein
MKNPHIQNNMNAGITMTKDPTMRRKPRSDVPALKATPQRADAETIKSIAYVSIVNASIGFPRTPVFVSPANPAQSSKIYETLNAPIISALDQTKDVDFISLSP